MEQHRLSAIPVVHSNGRPAGIVSATDLLSNLDSLMPVSRVMTEKVRTVAKDEEIGAAADVMRAQGIHRLVVTEGRAVVGVVSALDLLQFVAGDRRPLPIPVVKSVMTVRPQVVDVDDPLLHARALVVERDVRELAVRRGDTLVGVVTARDIKRALDPDTGPPLKDELFIRDLFIQEACQVEAEDPLDRVLAEMAERHMGSALVVEKGVLVGMLTCTEACRLFSQLLGTGGAR
jgi:acetoin utilization protein AcuB